MESSTTEKDFVMTLTKHTGFGEMTITVPLEESLGKGSTVSEDEVSEFTEPSPTSLMKPGWCVTGFSLADESPSDSSDWSVSTTATYSASTTCQTCQKKIYTNGLNGRSRKRRRKKKYSR